MGDSEKLGAAQAAFFIEQKTFLELIWERPHCYLTRSLYADWLEKKRMFSAASKQRHNVMIIKKSVYIYKTYYDILTNQTFDIKHVYGLFKTKTGFLSLYRIKKRGSIVFLGKMSRIFNGSRTQVLFSAG